MHSRGPGTHGFALAVTILTLCSFGTALGYPFVQWDDVSFIARIAALRFDAASAKAVFFSYDPELYVPLTFLSMKAAHVIGGGNPAVMHGFNIALHIINALLARDVLARVTGRQKAAAIAALLFAAHPLHTEAVVWVSGHKDLLCTMLGLLALRWHAAFATEQKRSFLALSVLFAGLAMSAKVTAVTLPLLMLLSDAMMKRRFSASLLREKLPIFALALVFGLAALGGKQDILVQTTFLQKTLIGAYALLFNAVRTLIPFSLSALHPYEFSASVMRPEIAASVAILAALPFLLSKYGNRGITYAITFYVIAAAPSLLNTSREGIVYVTYDRYAYMASLGMLLTAAIVMEQAWMKAKHAPVPLGFAVVLLLSSFVAISREQTRTWRETESIFLNVIEHYPRSALAYDKIASIRLQKGDAKSALGAAILANTSKKNHPPFLTNLGVAYGTLGDEDREIEAYLAAIAAQNNYLPARYNLARSYIRRDEKEAALRELRFIEERDPRYLDIARLIEEVTR